MFLTEVVLSFVAGFVVRPLSSWRRDRPSRAPPRSFGALLVLAALIATPIALGLWLLMRWPDLPLGILVTPGAFLGGALTQALLAAVDGMPSVRTEPGESLPSRSGDRLVFPLLSATMMVALLYLSRLVLIRAPSPAGPSGAPEQESCDCPQQPTLAEASLDSATQVDSVPGAPRSSDSLRAEIRQAFSAHDVTRLANALFQTLRRTLPVTVNAAELSSELARKFLEAATEHGAEKLVDFLVDLCQREEGAGGADLRPGADSAVRPVRHLRPAVVRFDFGRTAIPTAGYQTLDRLVERNRGVRTMFVLVGSADRPGTSPTNHRLALQRADSVRAFLIGRGIEPFRILARARTEPDLPIPTTDNVLEPENRRVEVLVR